MEREARSLSSLLISIFFLASLLSRAFLRDDNHIIVTHKPSRKGAGCLNCN
jgi:hypothetical protein